MRKFFGLGCLFVFFMAITASATADTFTTSSCMTEFAVNDGGSFYVKSSQMPPGAGSPPGLNASSSISGSNFHLTAGGTGYSDAGIVLYFNGGLKLRDLKSVSVSGAGSPVTINLWLDTGGDGSFFAFNSSARMTGLNGDTYGASGASLDANTSIVIMAGNGSGHSYTLAQLQAGIVPGITGNTGASLWIGITNSSGGPADISRIVVRTAADSALQSGGDRLAATQNADGGWGWPLTGASQQNTVGPTAMGLAKAYSGTGSSNQLAALQNAGAFLLTKTNTFSPPDGYLAAELDRVFGGDTYKNHVKTYYYDPLAAGTYNKSGAGALYTTASYVTFIRGSRASSPNLAAWDLGMGLVAAASCGASTTEWISGVKAEINELDGSQVYDVIGLAGAVYGLAFVHEDFNPTAGEHAAASNLNDLAAVLASYQINNGGFADNKNNVAAGHEAIQETAYSILALNQVNRSAYLNNIQGASNYLVGVQMATGGWGGESGGNPSDENNEVTGEALWSISTASIPTNTCSQYTITSSAGAGGGISPGGAVSVNYGASQPFTISPDANYHVADVLVDGSSVGAVTGYTFNSVTADHTISASFAINTNTITSSAGTGGSISPGGAVSVNYGANQPFTISPNANYHVADVLVDGSSVGAVTGYTFNGVTASHTITASFAATSPLTITTSSLPAGQVLTPYSQTLTATGGVLPYSWSVSAGALPDGLTVNNNTGEISGSPTTAGTFNFTAQVTDTTSSTAVRNLSIATAALPVRYGDPGEPINVDTIIQSAYDHCADGYIIEVQAMEFPSDVSCDRNVLVTLRGGFDAGFTSNPSHTTINGMLRISNGTVIVENIVIR